jgi:hypothetical protein
MATPLEEDKALAALRVMMKEFQTHKVRLAERAKSIAEALATGGISDVAALGQVVVEIFQELHDTTLSFQEETVQLILDEWSKEDDDDDDLDADDDDADDADPVDDPALDPDADDPSQLAPGDAAQLRRTSTDYKAMLDSMLAAPEAGYSPEQKKALEMKSLDVTESLALIDAIELRDEPGDAPS